MERKVHKALNFDLDTNALKEIYSPMTGRPFNYAYAELRSFLIYNGYEWRQGSGYVSVLPISQYDVQKLVENMAVKFKWLHECVNKFDVTNVGKQYDLTFLLHQISIEAEYDNTYEENNELDLHIEEDYDLEL